MLRRMNAVCIGGGPGGLYVAILLKRAWPDGEVTVYERNRADDTFGFGVVFSDETLGNLAAADPETYAAITADFAHWDAIDVHSHGEVLRSTGHGFSGLSRHRLLRILQDRARALGVRLVFETEVGPEDFPEADLVAVADGVNSPVRTRYADRFQPQVEAGANRFVWLGSTKRFPAFTFYFVHDEHGLWRAHCYEYEGGRSTFIVETTDATWRAAGLADADEAATKAFCERLFAEQLEGAPLLCNRSIWRQFPTVSNGRWHTGNVVLLGDAAHSAHFSVGSGTKLAMEDGIALTQALAKHPGDVPAALAAYEAERRAAVESTQRAAQVSLQWFEETERYFGRLEPLQFAFSLLTRSLRITHANLRVRDPAFVARVDARFAEDASRQSGRDVPATTPPMFTPFRLREVVVPNRVVVSPMCMYSAEDGTVDDFHLVHLGSRAMGGAGLVITEMTDVSRDGRITPGCAGMYRPEHVPAWRRVVDFVHRHTPAKIGLQIAHAGRKGSTRRMWEGIDEPLDDGNWPLLAPSPVPYLPHSQVPKTMDRADMDRVRDDFVRATEMAEEAGFDLVEVHFAHGYLLGTFLSPLTNLREDEYGGNVANRMRFPLEVFRAVRAAWPARKPVSVRISATDWKDGGFDADQAVEVARALREAGCDVLDVSAGQTVADQRPRYGRLFQTPFSDRIRHEVDIPTMTVGNISSYADVNSILAAGRADLCVLARAHLFDPYWTRHAAFEQGYPLPWPPQYCSIERYVPRFEWTPRGNEKPQ
jgi:anthraniloyl-CoA monooxygenase